MIDLAPNETVLLSVRRHWYVFVWPSSGLVFLLIFPALALIFAPLSSLYFFTSFEIRVLLNFLFALYLLALLSSALVTWASFYLDVWIITDRRIIDIEQHGLFHREISEIAMERIQNVTIEFPGVIPTLLKFGNIKIETASEGLFMISDVPHCYEAKDLILKYSHRRESADPMPVDIV